MIRRRDPFMKDNRTLPLVELDEFDSDWDAVGGVGGNRGPQLQ